MKVTRRLDVVIKYKYCTNCLAKSHTIRSCSSMATCKRCDRLHHTLLHPDQQSVRNSSRTTTNNNHKQQHRQQPPAQSVQQPTASLPSQSVQQPDTKILAEAIKSLAQVLCVTNDVTTVAKTKARRHVQSNI